MEEDFPPLWKPVCRILLYDFTTLYNEKTKERNDPMMRSPEKTIGSLIDRQKAAFIGSVDEDGFPAIKAMLPPRIREGIKTFYFTTNTSSMRVKQFQKNPKASLYFCDLGFFQGVMRKGTTEVLTDSAAKKLIWKEGDTMYYSQGMEDPDCCVLRFTAESGRYHSNFNSESFRISNE